MKKTILSLALIFSALTAKAQTVDEIIKNYYTAIGGDNWSKINGMKLTASTEAQGMKIPLDIVMLRDGRMYTKFSVQGMDFMQGAFDGKTLWSTNFMTQKAEKSDAEETENAKRAIGDFPNALVTASKNGYKASLIGVEKADGVDCYKIKLEKKTMLSEGKEVPNVEYYYIDKDSYALIMSEAEIPSGPYKGTISQTSFSDYQEVNGVFVPFSQKSGIKDGQSQTISFEKVELNPTVSDASFVFPVK